MAQSNIFPGRVIFDHLPKTGGQSINYWLRQALGYGCVTDNLIGDHTTLIRKYGGQYSIISGHLHFKKEGLDSRYDYVTCFRDPVDRALSFIYFVLENHSNIDLPVLRPSIQKFLESEGEECGDVFSHSVNVVEHLCSINGFFHNDPGKLVDHASSVLDNYHIWGIYERMSDFVTDLASFLDIPAPTELAKLNVTKKRSKADAISPRLRLKIEEIFALDIDLYRRLLSRYDKTRKKWQQPSVATPRWKPMTVRSSRLFSTADFSLISVIHEELENISQNSTLTFKIVFSLALPVSELECGIHIFDEYEGWAFGTNSTLLTQKVGPLEAGTHEVRHVVETSLPEGKYTVGFAFAEKSNSQNRELAWFDKLCRFNVTLVRNTPCLGYVCLPTTIFHHQKSRDFVVCISDGQGTIDFNSPPSHLPARKKTTLLITLTNSSDQIWQSLFFNPINISYHWFDELGDCIQFEGVRTPLPDGRLVFGQSVQVAMQLVTPATPGRYRLVVMPVIEKYCWLDKIGFIPSDLWINIVESSHQP